MAQTADILPRLEALAQPTRLEAYRLLLRYRPYGLAAGDIARLIAVAHNTLSTHLAVLETSGLVRSRREGRSVIYAAEAQPALELVAVLAEACGIPFTPHRTATAFPARREIPMKTRTYNVLILCTGNSARSIMAEAILNREGKGRFKAYSAGSRPKGAPNPAGLKLLAELGYDVTGFRSKSWDEFAGPDAPAMDFILTVCDTAAGEACPYWPGHPLVGHWGIPDPVDSGATGAERRAAFLEAYRRLSARISAFVNLPVETMDLATLKAELARIGGMDGATDMSQVLACAGEAA